MEEKKQTMWEHLNNTKVILSIVATAFVILGALSGFFNKVSIESKYTLFENYPMQGNIVYDDGILFKSSDTVLLNSINIYLKDTFPRAYLQYINKRQRIGSAYYGQSESEEISSLYALHRLLDDLLGHYESNYYNTLNKIMEIELFNTGNKEIKDIRIDLDNRNFSEVNYCIYDGFSISHYDTMRVYKAKNNTDIFLEKLLPNKRVKILVFSNMGLGNFYQQPKVMLYSDAGAKEIVPVIPVRPYYKFVYNIANFILENIAIQVLIVVLVVLGAYSFLCSIVNLYNKRLLSKSKDE